MKVVQDDNRTLQQIAKDVMASVTTPEVAGEKSRGEKIFMALNGGAQKLFGELMQLCQPKAGEKLDPNVQGLLAEVNVKLREAVYRAVDIATLVDRQDRLGERVAGPVSEAPKA